MITHTRQQVHLELVGSQETRLLQTPATKTKDLIRTFDYKYERSTPSLLRIAVTTHPGPVASVVVAFKQTVNERAPAALDQRVGVP